MLPLPLRKRGWHWSYECIESRSEHFSRDYYTATLKRQIRYLLDAHKNRRLDIPLAKAISHDF